MWQLGQKYYKCIARGDYLISDKDMSKEENLKLDNLRSLIKEMLAKKKKQQWHNKNSSTFCQVWEY